MRIASALISDPVASPSHRWASGIASLDNALGGGLAYGRVHEIYAAEADDLAAAGGFVVALAAAMANTGRGMMWLRTDGAARHRNQVQANGMAELGSLPGGTVLGIAPDNMAMLRMAVDALRCPALEAIIIEGHGHMANLDLTASRRLALAAEKSGVVAFLLRADADPRPSAAQTRWLVRAAPSFGLPGKAPGHPVFDIELLRQRSGPSGLRWRLEWDRDERIFRNAASGGAVVPVPASRSLAGAGTGVLHSIRRHAA